MSNLYVFLLQGGKELVGVTGAGRPSYKWPPISPALTRCQGMRTNLLLPVRQGHILLMLRIVMCV